MSRQRAVASGRQLRRLITRIGSDNRNGPPEANVSLRFKWTGVRKIRLTSQIQHLHSFIKRDAIQQSLSGVVARALHGTPVIAHCSAGWAGMRPRCLGATAQQEDEQQNWNRNPEQPQQNVSSGSCFFDFFV